MQKGVKYAFGAIALYLMVAYAGGSKLVGSSGGATIGLVQAFQGRKSTTS